MSKDFSANSPLNEVQLMLLRLFSRPMSKKDETAIRKMLLDYFNSELQTEVQKAIKEKNISREDFERLLK